MKIFLSWSGTRSEKVAKALNEWISTLIQAVEPWMSSVDVRKGARGLPEILDSLEGSKAGITCLTRENLNENWILFESGALSKRKDALLCTFLLDLSPSDVKLPLGIFQHTQFSKEDVKKLACSINEAVKEAEERSLSETKLNEMFDLLWPDLEKKIKEIKEESPESDRPLRDTREILEEILETVRKQDRRWRSMVGSEYSLREDLAERGLMYSNPGALGDTELIRRFVHSGIGDLPWGEFLEFVKKEYKREKDRNNTFTDDNDKEFE